MKLGNIGTLSVKNGDLKLAIITRVDGKPDEIADIDIKLDEVLRMVADATTNSTLKIGIQFLIGALDQLTF